MENNNEMFVSLKVEFKDRTKGIALTLSDFKVPPSFSNSLILCVCVYIGFVGFFLLYALVTIITLLMLFIVFLLIVEKFWF